jgi:hypothetical protein
MARIAEVMTEPQQVALVVALRQAGTTADVVQVAANERTIGSLLRGSSPLIEERGSKRVLTPLGLDVARYLMGTGDFDGMIPNMGDLLPPMPDNRRQ